MNGQMIEAHRQGTAAITGSCGKVKISTCKRRTRQQLVKRVIWAVLPNPYYYYAYSF